MGFASGGGGGGATNLDGLTDVDTTTDAPDDLDRLVYNASTELWTPRRVGVSGVATVDAAATSIAVTHGTGSAPALRDIQVTPTNSMGAATKFWVANPTSTTFDIVVDVAPGGAGATFAWQIHKLHDAGASGAFSPDQVAGLWLWLESDAITGLADGAEVTSWADQSAQANHATVAAGSGPTYYSTTRTINGKPVVHWPTAKRLNTALSRLHKPVSVFAVVRPTGTTAIRTVFGNVDTRAGPLQIRANAQTSWQALEQDTAVIASSNVAPQENVEKLLTFTYDAAGVWVWRVNRAAAGSGTNNRAMAGAKTTLGYRYGGVESYTGDIAALLIYDNVVSTTDRTSIEDYLAGGWGIP